ncbi:MAG: VCBS repeat-containing protein, partial [Myxococcales bacterium]|nr:VCBS repeat-containing protein [Myxococcales bacterium]
MRRWLLLASWLALAGCHDAPQTPAAGGLMAAKPVAADLMAPTLDPPTTFVHEVRLSEAEADAVSGGPAKAVCRALLRAGGEGLAAAVASDFAGRGPGSAGEPVALGDERLSLVHLPPGPPGDGAAFVAAVNRLSERFAAVEYCKLKPRQFRLINGGEAWAEFDFALNGHLADGQRAAAHGRPRGRLRKGATGWQWMAFDPGPIDLVATPRPWFVDVSAQTGVELVRAAETEQAVTEKTDDRSLETIGGVAVVDFDRDGRDDFMAWNRRRTLQVFVNDGRGGFRRILDPIPPIAVGLFQLLVDLDGDGREELVSTEVLDCADGQGTLGLFVRTEDGFAPGPKGALSFATPCGAYDQLTFQHVTAADVDRDGDLDLFVSGFSNRHSKGLRHNLFRSSDGEQNRLFINQGGLRFTEEAQARGLDGRRFSYSAEFFDYDEDGDVDLLVTNDYGPNEVFQNDGIGRFHRAVRTPLIENGQSMGVTVADLDRDGFFDVYVSNMYSKAGNRIVPLMEPDLTPETYQALLGLARGNSFYR